MKIQLLRAVLASAIAAIAFVAKAAPEPVKLPDIALNDAQLTVVDPSGEIKVYTPTDLEELPTYALRTRTPWREELTEFEGVLLIDLLQAHGLADAEAIRIIAENDFVSDFAREVWTKNAFLIATRVNGQPHSRRERGPFQIVIDENTLANSPDVNNGHLVWGAARIEVAD